MAGEESRQAADPYALQRHDRVRATFERRFFARLVPRLLDEAGGGRVLDLGCGDALAARLAGDRLTTYLGIDLRPVAGGSGGIDVPVLSHDLREGLGPVDLEPFDLYLATFGLASHLSPAQLRRLLGDIVAHARPGAIVALEALGLFSLEWPRLWSTPPGQRRTISYRLGLGGEVRVHPWAPAELSAMFVAAGITPLRTIDRTVQAGPKVADDAYWPGLPPVRRGLCALLEGTLDGVPLLRAPLPPLPAHPAADVHHELAGRRSALLAAATGRAPEATAEAVWELDPASGDGYGHGLTVIGRVD